MSTAATLGLACIGLAALAAAGCADGPDAGEANEPDGQSADNFVERIASHCGNAYAGRITANEPEQANDPFANQPLVMHVRECNADELKIPFYVGDDRSRTWVLTRTGDGLRLKHDHRHEDGTPDAVTMYGGDTADPGTAARQEFPVDADSIAMFEREGLTASLVNVWAMEIEPGQRFVYELARPGTDRLFRVEFDLTTPAATPPPPR
ncbi:MAG: hypothetical protein WD078_14135 [Woeseia sp.]